MPKYMTAAQRTHTLKRLREVSDRLLDSKGKADGKAIYDEMTVERDRISKMTLTELYDGIRSGHLVPAYEDNGKPAGQVCFSVLFNTRRYRGLQMQWSAAVRASEAKHTEMRAEIARIEDELMFGEASEALSIIARFEAKFA